MGPAAMSGGGARERVEFRATGLPGVLALEVDETRTRFSMIHHGFAFASVVGGTGAWRYRRWSREARPGIVMLFEPGEQHATTRVVTPASFRTLFVDAALVARAFAGSRAARGGLHLDAPELAEPALFRRALALTEALVRPDLYPGQKTDLLVATLGDLFEGSARSAAAPDLAPAPRTIARAYERILAEHEALRRGQTNGGRLVSVTALAEESGLPPVAFIRAFKRRYGMSPYQLVTALRVDHARQLIDEGPHAGVSNLAAVAAEAGYFDAAHFVRHFRRHLNTTPHLYARAVGDRWTRGRPRVGASTPVALRR